MKVHSTAVIDPRAELAENVSVGPYAIIEAGAHIQEKCQIGAHVHLMGNVRIGPENQIGPGSIIGAPPQADDFTPERSSGVIIGSRNVIREYVTVHRSLFEGRNTCIGDDNLVMTGAHLGHDVVLGDSNKVANNCLMAGHVIIGNRCFLGGGSVYHQFMRVGDHAMVQGLTALGLDVPPFAIAAGTNRIAGINVVGLRRSGFSARDRLGIKEAFDLFYASGLNFSQAIAKANQREWEGPAARFVDFFNQDSQRGFCLQMRRRSRVEAR